MIILIIFYILKIGFHSGKYFSYSKIIFKLIDAIRRLNCRLVSYHSLITKSQDYNMEDKWTFLVEGKKLNIPISPFLEVESLVCKNKNIEGGMGIFFYKNAAAGGDWILQERMTNSDWLSKLLPVKSPLSTMRVITASTYWLQQQNLNSSKKDSLSTNTKSKTNEQNTTSNSKTDIHKRYVQALSGVLRLGREGASTDHSSALFDVDIASGKIVTGVSNLHWYQLGLAKGMACTWLPPPVTSHHPDPPHAMVTGTSVPDMQEVLDIVTRYGTSVM